MPTPMMLIRTSMCKTHMCVNTKCKCWLDQKRSPNPKTSSMHNGIANMARKQRQSDDGNGNLKKVGETRSSNAMLGVMGVGGNLRVLALECLGSSRRWMRKFGCLTKLGSGKVVNPPTLIIPLVATPGIFDWTAGYLAGGPNEYVAKGSCFSPWF